LWPTRERLQVRPALASMLQAYRGYFHDLLQGDDAARARSRTTARNMRSNAEASLDRMRGEPGGDRRLLALADLVFANANRLVRASMLLEAALQDPDALRGHDGLTAFAADVEQQLDALAASLREGRAPTLTSLRKQERALAASLTEGGDEGSAHRAAIAEALDRIADSLDSLAHLLCDPAARHVPATHG
jgi:uncharacterized membrane protein YccC